VPYLAKISPRKSPRKRPRPRYDHVPLFLLPDAVVVATAALHKICALTGYPSELKHPLFILIYPMTFLDGLTRLSGNYILCLSFFLWSRLVFMEDIILILFIMI
jgi:hypothetical protein